MKETKHTGMRKAHKNSKVTHYKRRTKIRKGLYRYKGFFGKVHEIEIEEKNGEWNWISSGIDDNDNHFTFNGSSDTKKQARIDAQNYTEKQLYGNKLEDIYETL